MRRIGLAILAAASAATLTSAPASAQGAFEGVITFDMTGDGMSMEITQSVKGNMMRQEMQGPMGAMVQIMDTESLDMTMLMPAQKMYMTMNVKSMMEQAQVQNTEPKPSDFKATGRKETIAGHSCEHYTYAQEGTDIDMCVAGGLGYMPFSSPGMRRGGGPGALIEAAAWRAKFPGGFVPLSMTVTSQGQTMTMTAKKVERKGLSADLFKVPEGYQKMPGPGGN